MYYKNCTDDEYLFVLWNMVLRTLWFFFFEWIFVLCVFSCCEYLFVVCFAFFFYIRTMCFIRAVNYSCSEDPLYWWIWSSSETHWVMINPFDLLRPGSPKWKKWLILQFINHFFHFGVQSLNKSNGGLRQQCVSDTDQIYP